METLEARAVADRLLTALAKIGLAIRSESWQERAAHGLTPTQQQVIVLLRSRGALGMARLAELLGVRPPTATDAVRALERKGLLRRQRDSVDRRRVRVELTEAGARMADRVAQWPDAFLKAVHQLSPSEQGVLLRVASKMIRTLQEEGKISVARMCLTCRFFRPHVYPDPERPHHCAFVEAPFGERELRLDCPDYQAADDTLAAENWRRFQARTGESAPYD